MIPLEAQPNFEGQVRDLSKDGFGVVNHPNGSVCFVPGCWPGDRARFRIVQQKKNYAFAELVELLEASPDRVVAPCRYQGNKPGECGGCPWMIGSYESQLRFKAHRVQHALKRAQLLSEDVTVLPILPSEKVFGYRNRAQFKSQGRNLGYFSQGSHVLCEVRECLILNEKMERHLETLWGKIDSGLEVPKPKGFDYVFIDVDEDQDLGSYPVNERRPFKQGNSCQNEAMREWIRARVQTWTRDAELIELFCGSGNFTEVFSELGFQKVLAVEVVEEALQALKNKDLPGVTTRALNLHEAKNFYRLAESALNARYLFLDPTRAGALGIEKLARSLPKLQEILYVSCDLETFVRDAQALKRVGFEIAELQPLDLFPHTAHVEVLSRIQRRR